MGPWVRAAASYEASPGELARVVRRGGVSLVLGAGIGLSSGVPSWSELVRTLWESTFPRRQLPPSHAIPQLWPLAFEMIARELGHGGFVKALRAALYARVEPAPGTGRDREGSSLSVIAAELVRDWRRGARRRVTRVITLNVDDVLEEALWGQARGAPVVRPIVRAGDHPELGPPDHPIPLYHLHGFLPRRQIAPRRAQAADALIFTDAQYWSAVSEPLSFPNRVMSFALHDSPCLFIGFSMTDLNLLRWLATRAIEIEEHAPGRAGPTPESTRRALSRHFWIRPDADDEGGFLSPCLALRGVRSVGIPGWAGAGLRELLDRCLGAR